MPVIEPTIWTLIPQIAGTILAAAAAVLAATWSKSPVHLPLPSGSLNPWLRGVPIIASAAILVILRIWFTDCYYVWFLTKLLIATFFLCVGLIVAHYHIHKKTPDASTLLMVICFGWSILGTLTICCLVTAVLAWQQGEDAYKKNPLTLSRIVAGQKQDPGDAIYLPAKLAVHLEAEMDECHNHTPEMSLTPPIGQLVNGTYTAPQIVEHEQKLTISAKSIVHRDTKIATIILVPDPSDIQRVQYSGKDDQNREAIFDFIIISKSNSWVKGSEEFVKKNHLETLGVRRGPQEVTPVCRPTMELARSNAFDPYVDIITIGTASREGTTTEETNRAGRRSRRIAEWVNLALSMSKTSKHVYTMNLGQYLPGVGEYEPPTEEEDKTAQERPVVLVGVVRKGEINLTEALRNLFNQHQENEFFKFLATHYPGREIHIYNELPKTNCTGQ